MIFVKLFERYATEFGIFSGMISIFLPGPSPMAFAEGLPRPALPAILAPQYPNTMLYWKEPTGGSGTWNTTDLDWVDLDAGNITAWPGPPAGANFYGTQGGTVNVAGGIQALFLASAAPGGYTFRGGDITLPRGLGDATIAGPTADSGLEDFSVFESDIRDTAAVLSAQSPVPAVYIRGAVKFKGTKSYQGNTYIGAQGKLLLGDEDPDTEFTDLNGDIGFVNLIPYPQDEAWGVLEYNLAGTLNFNKVIISSLPKSEIQFFCKTNSNCIINYNSDNNDYIGETYCHGCTINLDGNMGGPLSNLNEDGEYSPISITGSGIIGQPGDESSFYGAVIVPAVRESTSELLFRGSVRTYQSEPNGENNNRTLLGFAFSDEVDESNSPSFATLRITEDFEPWDGQIDVVLVGTLAAPGQYRLASFGGVPNAPLVIHTNNEDLLTPIPLQTDVELLPNGEGFDLVLMATQQ